MRVDDYDGNNDGGDDKYHGEQHVFPDERNGAGGGRDELHDNEQEDGEGQQDGDRQSHLFTCGCGGDTARYPIGIQTQLARGKNSPA